MPVLSVQLFQPIINGNFSSFCSRTILHGYYLSMDGRKRGRWRRSCRNGSFDNDSRNAPHDQSTGRNAYIHPCRWLILVSSECHNKLQHCRCNNPLYNLWRRADVSFAAIHRPDTRNHHNHPESESFQGRHGRQQHSRRNLYHRIILGKRCKGQVTTPFPCNLHSVASPMCFQ